MRARIALPQQVCFLRTCMQFRSSHPSSWCNDACSSRLQPPVCPPRRSLIHSMMFEIVCLRREADCPWDPFRGVLTAGNVAPACCRVLRPKRSWLSRTSTAFPGRRGYLHSEGARAGLRCALCPRSPTLHVFSQQYPSPFLLKGKASVHKRAARRSHNLHPQRAERLQHKCNNASWKQ